MRQLHTENQNIWKARTAVSRFLPMGFGFLSIFSMRNIKGVVGKGQKRATLRISRQIERSFE